MRFSLLLSLAIALVLGNSASALELIRTLPASDVNQSFYGVSFLIFDGPEAIEPIQTADFGPGQYWLQEQGKAQVVIGAELDQDIDPRGLWIETELDGQTRGERVPLRVVTPGVTFASGNNLNMDGGTITNLAMLAAPGDVADAVNRAYVDTKIDIPPAGVNTGDMQYWDGARWAVIARGGNEQRLSVCEGVLAWTTEDCVTYDIGDLGPAGGRVFYISNGGKSGMEAALADQSSDAPWGCHGVDVTGATGTAVGTGAQNTAAIIAHPQCIAAGIAAKIADDYSQNGFTDYFLPSKDELNLLYKEKTFVGGVHDAFYWSSSQVDSDKAWVQYMNDGSIAALDKNQTRPVRAVRAF